MDSDDWQDIGEIASCLALDFHRVLDQVWPNSICCDVLPKCFSTATTFDRSCASLSANNRQGCSKGCIISIDQDQLLLVLNGLTELCEHRSSPGSIAPSLQCHFWKLTRSLQAAKMIWSASYALSTSPKHSESWELTSKHQYIRWFCHLSSAIPQTQLQNTACCLVHSTYFTWV